MVFNQMRLFGAHAAHHEPAGRLFSGRKHGNPGYYNKRFEPSQGNDGNFFEHNSTIRGADGFEPRQTQRNPNKFSFSNNIFKGDYWEWRMRGADYLYQIGTRLHRSNDGWTRTLFAWTSFSFLMASQALVWKIHFVCGSLVLLARIRDKGAEPTVDEINVLDTIFANERLAQLFTPKTYHVIDYDQEWDEGRANPYFPEYRTKTAKFFNADSNTTTGLYKIGDVESGATMTLHFKTMPFSNNKYHFTEPFLIYDMYAVVSHNGNVFTESLVKAEETLRTKSIFVPWH
jgi:hypothetical protein